MGASRPSPACAAGAASSRSPCLLWRRATVSNPTTCSCAPPASTCTSSPSWRTAATSRRTWRRSSRWSAPPTRTSASRPATPEASSSSAFLSPARDDLLDEREALRARVAPRPLRPPAAVALLQALGIDEEVHDRLGQVLGGVRVGVAVRRALDPLALLALDLLLLPVAGGLHERVDQRVEDPVRDLVRRNPLHGVVAGRRVGAGLEDRERLRVVEELAARPVSQDLRIVVGRAVELADVDELLRRPLGHRLLAGLAEHGREMRERALDRLQLVELPGPHGERRAPVLRRGALAVGHRGLVRRQRVEGDAELGLDVLDDPLRLGLLGVRRHAHALAAD